jgi:fibronectin-binding autotransporter adhesin
MKRRLFTLLAASALAFIVLGTSSQTQAAIYYWDGTTFGDNSASGGGGGTWSTSTAAWDTPATEAAAVIWANGNDAVFAGTAGTVLLGSSVSATSLSFNTASYILDVANTVNTNILTIGSGGIVGAQSATLRSTVAGGNITLNGSQTWDFTGRTLSLTGVSLTVNTTASEVLTFKGTLAGTSNGNYTLNVKPQFKLGSAVTVASGGNNIGFRFDGGIDLGGFNLLLGARNTGNNGASTVTGKITGASASGGTLTIQSDVAQTLNGVNSLWQFSNNTNDYTGTTTVSSGRLQVSVANALGATGAGNETTISHATTGGGTLMLSGGVSFAAEALTINGNGWFVDQGALFNASGNNTWSGTIALGNATNNRINAAATTTLTIAGAISGANPLEINGTSNSTGYTYAGIPTGTNVGGSGGTGVIVPPTGTLSFTAASTGFTGNTTVTNGTLRFDTAGSLGASGSYAGNISINTGATLAFNSTAAQTLSGSLSGAGSLTKANSGTVTITADNSLTFTGNTSVSAGTLLVGHNNALGTGTLTLSGGSFGTSGASPLTVPNNMTINGNLTTLNGNNSTAPAKLTLSGTMTLSGTSQWQINNSVNNQNLEISGKITGTGGLQRGGGGGSVTLSGPNDFSGGLTWSGGSVPTLIIANNSALGTGTFTQAGTNAKIATGSTAITNSNNNPIALNNDFSFEGPSALNLGTGAVTMSAARTITVNSSTLTLAGVVGDSGSGFGLTKAGSFTLALSGTNTYSGGTSVNAGTLQITGSGTLGSGSYAAGVTIASGATLAYNSSATQTLSGAISGAGSLTQNGSAGTLTIMGDNSSTYTGNTTLSSGTMQVAHNNALGTGTLILSSGSFAVSGASPLTVSNNVTINGNLTTLNGNNTTAPAKLTLAGTVTLSGTSQWQINNSVNSQNLEISGKITGTGGLQRGGGGGSVTLSGPNDFSGGFTWSGGSVPSLIIANNSAFGTGTFTQAGSNAKISTGSTAITNSNNNPIALNNNFSFEGPNALNLGTGAVTINAARTITVNSSTLAMGGAISESGSGFSLTKAGTGTLNLSGASTYSGGTTLSAGTLLVNNTSDSDSALGTGSVIVNSGATLGGSGSVILTGANTITVNGALSIGNSTDTLGADLKLATTTGSGSTILGSSSNLTFDIFSGAGHGTSLVASQADLLRVVGDLTINTGATLSLRNPNAITSSSWAAGDTFQLLDWANLGTRTGTFTTVDSSALELPSGLMWNTSDLYTLGTISIAVVPEPSRTLLTLLTLLSLTSLLMLRRRR